MILPSLRVLAGLIALMTTGCINESLTAANVRKIQVCSSRKSEVRELFDSPDEVGIVGGMTQWTYFSEHKPTLLVLFDGSGTVVDIAYRPAGLVQLKNRCN